MKKLLGILVLGLFLITPTQADDIRDLEIEGMSIGDSLLDYFSEEEIEKNIMSYYKNKAIIKIACFNWSKESSYIPHLRIGVLTEEYSNWLDKVR